MRAGVKQPSSPYVLTIDVGTSSTRAILYDATGEIVDACVGQRTTQATTSADGGAVFDADELFTTIVEVVDQVIASAGPCADAICAVAMDTLVGNVLGVDKSGAAVSPVFTYADTRDAADAQQLRDELGAEGQAESHDRVGCLIHGAYLPARFRWLERTHPEALKSAHRWVSIGEYAYHKLFGQWRVSYSVASWAGLLNRRELCWDREWLEKLPVSDEQLSPLGDLNTPLQGLQGTWRERWPALSDIPWLLAIGDGAAVNVGSGCDSPERVALTVGSTGAMRVVMDPDIDRVPDGLWLYRVDAKRGLLGGATTEGGNLFGWLRETLILPEPNRLEELLLQKEPDAHGLTVLPFIAGERAPGWREDARACVQGLTLHTRPDDIVQACLEGIAFRFAIIYARILPNLPTGMDHDIIASGGGLLRSPAWLQIFADVLGAPVSTLHEQEATSRGLALLALEQIGVIDKPSDLPPATGETFMPIMEHHQVYSAAVERQAGLYQRVLD